MVEVAVTGTHVVLVIVVVTSVEVEVLVVKEVRGDRLSLHLPMHTP